MTVVYRPRGRSRERILAYGTTGVGKTYAALTIMGKALGPGEKAYIIDADNTWARTLETDGAALGVECGEELFWDTGRRRFVADDEYVVEGGQAVVYHTEGWEQHEAAIADAFKRAGRDDWVIIDSMTWLWDDILPWYIKKVHGDDLPDFLMEARVDQVKAGKKNAAQGATGGQEQTVVEWNFINPRWNKNIAGPIANAKCHVWLCAEAKPMRTDGRIDAQVKQLYDKVGFIPSSQKRLGHQVQTVLFLSLSKTGKYSVTTVKDRGRDVLRSEEWADMGAVYLRKIAGWKPTKITDNEGAA